MLNKVRQSEETRSSSDDIFVPPLWYYDLLIFIIEDERGKLGMSSLEDDLEFKLSNSF